MQQSVYHHDFGQQCHGLRRVSSGIDKREYPVTLPDCDRTQIDRSQASLSNRERIIALQSLLSGHYEILPKLGSGGLGTTFWAKGVHRPGNPGCVVKKLIRDFGPQELEEARRLFATEAQTLEALGNDE